MSELIKVDNPVDGVIRVRINRPDKRNAMDHATRAQLIAALGEAKTNPGCRAIVFGGVEGVFSAGGDLPSMKGLDEAGARERMRHVAEACRMIDSIPQPFVSAAEGFCAGAAVGLALLGDWIVVDEDSRILFPFLNLGLTPDWGLCRSLPARIGLPASRRILTRGKPVDGKEAAAIGLADECAEQGQCMEQAIEKARQLATLSPRAFARMKQRLAWPSQTLEEELKREEDDQAALLSGQDFSEGLDAFMEKRRPQFQSLGKKG